MWQRQQEREASPEVNLPQSKRAKWQPVGPSQKVPCDPWAIQPVPPALLLQLAGRLQGMDEARQCEHSWHSAFLCQSSPDPKYRKGSDIRPHYLSSSALPHYRLLPSPSKAHLATVMHLILGVPLEGTAVSRAASAEASPVLSQHAGSFSFLAMLHVERENVLAVRSETLLTRILALAEDSNDLEPVQNCLCVVSVSP